MLKLCFIVYLVLIYSQNTLSPEKIKISQLSKKELHTALNKNKYSKLNFGEKYLSFPVKPFFFRNGQSEPRKKGRREIQLDNSSGMGPFLAFDPS